eukprot:210604-Hanusia_phi.AAC.1
MLEKRAGFHVKHFLPTNPSSTAFPVDRTSLRLVALRVHIDALTFGSCRLGAGLVRRISFGQ